MQYRILLGVSLLIIVSQFQVVSGDYFHQCIGLANGAFIAGTKGCQSYIYCEGEISYEGFCPSQLLFNPKDGSCASAHEVDCVDDIEPDTSTTTYTTIGTTTPPPITIPEVFSTREEVQSSTEFKLPSDVEHFTGVPMTSLPIITSTIISGGGSTSKPIEVCPASDNPNEIIFLPSDESCGEYFVCYHGTPVQMHCSGKLYFDYLTSKCDLPERVNCKVAGSMIPNPKKECTANIFDFFPYPKNCNYFYKCIHGFLSLQQCPIGFGWSNEMKLCLKLSQGKCPTTGSEQEQSPAWMSRNLAM